MMTDRAGETSSLPEPSDTERVAVLGRLIYDRIAVLNTARAHGKFTPADARELFVLEHLRDTWLLESAD